jgi:hypothetical protein
MERAQELECSVPSEDETGIIEADELHPSF